MASIFRERSIPPTEVRRILRRAAEIAETDPETRAVELPLTQDELTRRAAELGLPASAVQRAIGAPGAGEPPGDKAWLKPRTVVLEQEIAGEVPAERYEEIVDAIRAAAGIAGRTEVIGKTLTWYSGPTTSPLVTVRSRDGRTQVRIEQILNGVAALISLSVIGLFASAMGAAIAMDASRSAPFTALVASVMMLGAFVISWTVAARGVRRREALLGRVMERTCAAVESAASPPVRARVAEVPAAALESLPSDIDALAAAEAEAEAFAAAPRERSA